MNVPPLLPILIAMAVQWCNTSCIVRWRRSRAFIKPLKAAIRRLLAQYRPDGRRATENKMTMQYVSTLLTVTMAVAVRQYYTAHITR